MPDSANGLTLLTPTRNRPKCFALLERYIARQTYRGPLQWLVCNDGTEPYTYTMGQEVVLRDPSGDDPQIHSICYNYRCLIPQIKCRKILFVEDDDWYGPEYLAYMSGLLDTADLFGSAPGWYYHIGSRRWEIRTNLDHCALAQTGITSAVLPYLEIACQLRDNPFIDMFLWSHWVHAIQGGWKIEPNRPGLHIGLKGLWGERGIGLGHDPRRGRQDYQDETGAWIKLQEWLGPDEMLYR